jgi:nucleoside-diphosphate-sugar epimerase
MVVITGGAGFIGSNLVHYWIEKMTEAYRDWVALHYDEDADSA